MFSLVCWNIVAHSSARNPNLSPTSLWMVCMIGLQHSDTIIPWLCIFAIIVLMSNDRKALFESLNSWNAIIAGDTIPMSCIFAFLLSMYLMIDWVDCYFSWLYKTPCLIGLLGHHLTPFLALNSDGLLQFWPRSFEFFNTHVNQSQILLLILVFHLFFCFVPFV